MSLRTADQASTLADVIDRILDKGVIINADITVTVVGVELLGLRIRAAVASFETAARYGLQFPSGVNLDAPAWKQFEAAPATSYVGGAPSIAAAIPPGATATAR